MGSQVYFLSTLLVNAMLVALLEVAPNRDRVEAFQITTTNNNKISSIRHQRQRDEAKLNNNNMMNMSGHHSTLQFVSSSSPNYSHFSHHQSRSRISTILTKMSNNNNNNNEDSDDSDDDILLHKEIDPTTLIDMDIVIFSTPNDPSTSTTATNNNNDNNHNIDNDYNNNTPKYQIGAIQEDATLAPLSAWTLENPFEGATTSQQPVIEFVVDEHDRWLPQLDFNNHDDGNDNNNNNNKNNIKIHYHLDDSHVSYGSRQVGGGKGPGNPHGEESELIYYVDRELLERFHVQLVLKPELEILW